MKNIVIIGGGTGTSLVLQGLKKYPVHLSAVVSTADDGGSTGRLRQQFGGVPVGDIRACLLALSNALPIVNEQMAYRNKNGHVTLNIALAQYQKALGINAAISHVSKFLKVKGNVVPVTLSPTTLSATLENGQVIKGEHNIDEPKHNTGLAIKKLKLQPSGPANPKALEVIRKADMIVFSPGDLYTSVLPNILVKDLAKAIKRSSAVKVMVVNTFAKRGQTHGYKISDFIATLEQYLETNIDVVIVNTEKPKVSQQGFAFIKADLSGVRQDVKIIAKPLLSRKFFKKNKSDKLQRSKQRHDSEKLAKIIYKLVN